MDNINHNIELTEQEMEVCNASPLEVLNYYIIHPNELLVEATKIGVDAKDYLYNLLFDASEQINRSNL